MIESFRICCHQKVITRIYVIELNLRSLYYPYGTLHYCYVSCGQQYKFLKSFNRKVLYVVVSCLIQATFQPKKLLLHNYRMA